VESDDRPTYSFVLPVMNEEETLGELHRRLAEVAERLDGECEFVFVDDGSTDASRQRLLELRSGDPRVKLVSLSRNFGHQLAISAGLDFARGEAVITMDADLQDPPELVPEMVARWREGFDVVHAVRPVRAGESRAKQAVRRLAYRLLKRAADDVPLALDAGDFRLIDGRVADIVRSMREPNRYLRGLFAWVGYRQTAVTYERAARQAGEAKYSWRRLIHLGADGLLSFSTAPLRLILGLGFAIAGLAFLLALVAIIGKLADAYDVPGWASLVVTLSFFSGVQLILLGTVGLYVGRIHDQGKHRPLYLVDEVHGFERPAPPERAESAVPPPRGFG
jgi:polyisoprenyl-phosphate glycosyltransferase